MAAPLSVVLLWGTLLWRISSSFQHGNSRPEMLEDKIFREIFRNYNKAVRPATMDTKIVVVKHGMSVTRLVELKDDVMTFDTWIDMGWNDARLRWEPDDHDDVSRVNIPTDLIWMPDIVLYNSAGTATDMYPSMPRQAHVTHDGTIHTAPAMRLRVWCGRTEGCSPVDQQGSYTCDLKFGSWVYDGFSVDLQNRQESIDLSHYSQHTQWSVKNSSVNRNVVLYSYCPEPYLDITYTIQLAPKYGHARLV
ncbi:neuronal acetylcholine receptor subunit alpha-2-like [Mizuhopecten yessoensis]|uniref:Neuronal acetylcholine receptor subunit alpha-2 n=1 Tax=Mizuhopecten yessoensis TaxID=6573 RepID=A0A210Q1T7_MIZYE|nr:neuronal acetylcholine receptor subunit alpha-2-like [Mizuhopecten yessoensis]OWF42649.1 Neuronal acetylcholine receptor subunit alpha-2 [Mizuhopecten yessoensis]